MATGGHFGFWLLTNPAAIFARVMGGYFFSKYFKELKSSVKPYYALSGHGTPRLHPTIIPVNFGLNKHFIAVVPPKSHPIDTL